MVAPEYNGSIPGALKYFIDLLPFPEAFEDRPVAFVGIASGRVGRFAYGIEHLQHVILAIATLTSITDESLSRVYMPNLMMMATLQRMSVVSVSANKLTVSWISARNLGGVRLLLLK